MAPPPPPSGGDGGAPAPVAAAVRPLTIEEAEAELASCSERERELELELEKLYGRAAHLCQSESRSLAYAGEQHKQVPAAIRKLQETLQQTSTVADELSGRVRNLDAVCGRVGEALKLVDDMLELRECSDHVMKAISSEDFEQATKYVARFKHSQDNLPPGTDDASIRVLCEAEQQLSAIVRKKFEAAIMAKDSVSVTRFAKLFHPLGLTGEGVQKYTEFIRRSFAEKCAQDFKQLMPSFAKRADAEPTPYAQALTQAFMEIADIVQEHQQSVEQNFGPENFILVIRGLVDEADTQAIRVIEKFAKDNSKAFDNQSNCDMRDVGMVLEETALITQRTHQFDSYIHNVARDVVGMIADREAYAASLPPGHSKEDGLVELSKLGRRVQELVSSYVLVEQTFLLQAVAKAIREADALDPTDPEQLTTTLVDDAFFILQQCMFRSITTFDINAVCAVVNYVASAVSGEIRTALLSNLTESKRSYSNWATYARNIAPRPPGQHPLASLFQDSDGKPRYPLTAANSWPHSLNNLQQCVEYLDKLKEATEEAFNENFPPEGPDRDKRVMFQQCISELEASKAELESLHAGQCKEGVNMLQMHLKPMLEPLATLDYDIGEKEYADFQVNDPYAKAFNAQTEIIYQHVKSVMNLTSCEEVMQQLAERTCRRLEREALTKRFSILGALQFETDVRVLCSFFTNVSEQALRHKFARLFEMASILNLENVEELRELFGETRTWRLAPDEIRKLLDNRTDFEASRMDLDMILPS